MAPKQRPLDPTHPTLRNPDWVRQVYDSARQPEAWLHAAKKLRTSADAIFERENPIADRFYGELIRGARAATGENPSSGYFDEVKFPWPNFGAAFMLMAFAIENLLKGLAIEKGKVELSKLELPQGLKSHDLDELHQLAKPRATAAQHVLDHLTYMSWAGRYPCPTEAGKFWPTRKDGTIAGIGTSWPQSHNDVLAYYDALAAELQELSRQ
jgi:hypothetical protein